MEWKIQQEESVKILTLNCFADKTFVYLENRGKTVDVTAGASEVVLRIKIRSYPQPVLRWYHNGVAVNTSLKKYENR